MKILYIAKKKEINPLYHELANVSRIDLSNPYKPEDVSGADVLVTDLTPITAELLRKLSDRLKIVATLTTGTDHIDTAYLKEHGIRLVTLLDCKDLATITSTGEHTFGLIIALARHYKRAFRDPETPREELRGQELQGKTLGIIGVGRVGKQVKKFGEVFGMRIKFFDPYLKTKGSLEDVLGNSDFVTIHAPLNDETRGMITFKHFEAMKGTAAFINTSRGELVEKGALVEALRTAMINTAASDFYDDEMLEYAKHNDCLLLTNHLGGATVEGLEKADSLIARELKKIL